MDENELNLELSKRKKQRTKLIKEILANCDVGLIDEAAILKDELAECNKEITYLERELEGNLDRLFCCIKLSDLRNALVEEELKQMQGNAELMVNYCELKPAKIICYEKGKKYGNNFIKNGTIKENLDILTKQKYLAYKILIPTNNSEHFYAFAVKLHMNKKLVDDLSLKQKLIKLKFNVNNIKLEDLYVDITYATLQKYYKTDFEKILKDLLSKAWSEDTINL